jgi:hypothetical protein
VTDAEVIGTGKWHIQRPDRNGHQVTRRIGWCDRWGRREDIIVEVVPTIDMRGTERVYPGK